MTVTEVDHTFLGLLGFLTMYVKENVWTKNQSLSLTLKSSKSI